MAAFHYHELMSSLHAHKLRARLSAAIALLALLIVGTACTPSKRPSEPPVVRISGIHLAEPGRAQVDLMLTNLNRIDLIGIDARIEIYINNELWLRWEAPINWAIPPNAREVVQIEARTTNQQVQDWLNEVASGERPNVTWTTKLSISLPKEAKLESEGSGFLYRVPGSLSRFR